MGTRLKTANLTAAVENGAAVAPLVAKLPARQAERDTLLAEIGAAQATQTVTVTRKSVEQQVLAKVGNWRALLDGDVATRRQVLLEVLDGRSTSHRRATRIASRGWTGAGD